MWVFFILFHCCSQRGNQNNFQLHLKLVTALNLQILIPLLMYWQHGTMLSNPIVVVKLFFVLKIPFHILNIKSITMKKFCLPKYPYNLICFFYCSQFLLLLLNSLVYLNSLASGQLHHTVITPLTHRQCANGFSFETCKLCNIILGRIHLFQVI